MAPRSLTATQPFRGATKPIAQVIATRVKGPIRARFPKVHLGQEAIQAIPWGEALLLAPGAAQPTPDRWVPIGILLNQNPLLKAYRL